ncbi:porin family protein [Pseudomaricurvus sp. HS19]|uniref:porin family protein n=1 Tax=Pseudomaricurvus sp. HS19 TaxID=2692626 RepID=UPI00136B00C8|nr:porin family protein [Pseudomaricurvus sp. HS19]MYM63047.1 outer membrane beta-barrel protein [Pseudomaricurvus sp. HS19]
MFKKTVMASTLLLLSAAATAQSGETGSFYAGVSLGLTDVDVSGFDKGRSIALVGGYRVNENLALEGSYIDLGEAEDGPWTIEADGFNFAAVGILPINDQFEVFGKLGLFGWDASVHRSGYGQVESDDGIDLSIGFGASLELTPEISVVAEYQHFELDSDDVSNISVGARYSF